MAMLREFIGSSSGLAPARQGLGLGWVISALTGVAVLLGAKEAEAGCEDNTWVREFGYSASCDEATDGNAPFVCQDCRQTSDCMGTVCGSRYCCA